MTKIVLDKSLVAAVQPLGFIFKMLIELPGLEWSCWFFFFFYGDTEDGIEFVSAVLAQQFCRRERESIKPLFLPALWDNRTNSQSTKVLLLSLIGQK